MHTSLPLALGLFLPSHQMKTLAGRSVAPTETKVHGRGGGFPRIAPKLYRIWGSAFLCSFRLAILFQLPLMSSRSVFFHNFVQNIQRKAPV